MSQRTCCIVPHNLVLHKGVVSEGVVDVADNDITMLQVWLDVVGLLIDCICSLAVGLKLHVRILRIEFHYACILINRASLIDIRDEPAVNLVVLTIGATLVDCSFLEENLVFIYYITAGNLLTRT